MVLRVESVAATNCFTSFASSSGGDWFFFDAFDFREHRVAGRREIFRVHHCAHAEQAGLAGIVSPRIKRW